MRFVRINDVVISHDIHGQGSGKPAIAFINSLGTDRRIWNRVVEALAPDFTILTFDKRGHGLSDLAAPPYRIEDFSGDLAGLIDHYGLNDVIVCGLSVGGPIALDLYRARPDLVRALVLADTAHRIGTPEFWNARIEAVRQGGIASILEPIMSRWFTAAYRRDDNADYRGYCTMLARQSPEGYAGTCAAVRDANFTEVAQSVTVPTFCIAGAEDGSTPPELVKSLADLIPASRFAIIPDAAHLPCVEAPETFIALLHSFIDDLPGA